MFTIKEIMETRYYNMPKDGSFRGRLSRIKDITDFCFDNGIAMSTDKIQAMMVSAPVSYTEFVTSYADFFNDVYDEVRKLGLMESEAKLPDWKRW